MLVSERSVNHLAGNHTDMFDEFVDVPTQSVIILMRLRPISIDSHHLNTTPRTSGLTPLYDPVLRRESRFDVLLVFLRSAGG